MLMHFHVSPMVELKTINSFSALPMVKVLVFSKLDFVMLISILIRSFRYLVLEIDLDLQDATHYLEAIIFYVFAHQLLSSKFF